MEHLSLDAQKLHLVRVPQEKCQPEQVALQIVTVKILKET